MVAKVYSRLSETVFRPKSLICRQWETRKMRCTISRLFEPPLTRCNVGLYLRLRLTTWFLGRPRERCYVPAQNRRGTGNVVIPHHSSFSPTRSSLSRRTSGVVHPQKPSHTAAFHRAGGIRTSFGLFDRETILLFAHAPALKTATKGSQAEWDRPNRAL